jgi:hypothetical protein
MRFTLKLPLTEEQQDHKGLKVLQERKDLLVRKVNKEPLVLKVPLEWLEPQVLMVLKVQLVHKVLQELFSLGKIRGTCISGMERLGQLFLLEPKAMYCMCAVGCRLGVVANQIYHL